LEITIDKSKIQKIINNCLKQNGFLDNANALLQLTKALGTGAFVPYLDKGVLRINYLNATNIVILKANKREVIDVLFWCETKTLGGTELTINAHILDETGYTIYNRKYFKSNDGEYKKVDLGELEMIETKSFIPKFAMIYTPSVNNLDINTPYGLSCYGNAIDNILMIDKVFDTLDNETWLGRKRVYLSSKATQFNVDENGTLTPVFDPTDVAFYNIPGEDNKEHIKESSFDLRVDELTSALQAQLNLYTSKVGLGHNYYKFKDGEVYVNTDNVISSNSDVYRKIKKQENIITKAITNLCYAIAELVGIKGEFSVSVFYDDSIIEDQEKIRLQAQSEYNCKLISKAQYYRDVYKLKDKEALAFAEQMNQEIKDETIVDGSEFDLDE
jgi:A118 family predicted phage portal protein